MPLVPPLGGTLQMVETPIGPMAVETLGEGQTIVLLHAPWPLGSRDEWHALAPLLAQAGYRVLAPDLLGFGDSPAPAAACTANDLIASLRDWLASLAPAVVVARGMAMAYAAACCQDGAAFPALVAVQPQGAEAAPPPPDPEAPEAALARDELHHDARLDWIVLPQPILLLWGEFATPTTDDASRWLMPLRPDAPPMMIQGEPVGVHKQSVYYQTFRDTGSFPHIEAAEAVAHVIVGWLERLGLTEVA